MVIKKMISHVFLDSSRLQWTVRWLVMILLVLLLM